MKKVFLLLAVMCFMLLSLPASAEVCPPLRVTVNVHYDNSLEHLPADSLCVTVIWDFGDVKCEQHKKLSTATYGSNQTGYLSPLQFILNTENDCPEECMTADDVKFITVIVSNCKNIVYVTGPGIYTDPITAYYHP
jgi:hypothetical protein